MRKENLGIAKKWIIQYGFEIFLTRVKLTYPCSKGEWTLSTMLKSGDDMVLDPRLYKQDNDGIGTICLNLLDPMIVRICIRHSNWEGREDILEVGVDVEFIRMDMIRVKKSGKK